VSVLHQSFGKYVEKAPRNLSSASCPERFTPEKTTPVTHLTWKLGLFQSRSEFFGDETNVLLLLEIKLRFCDLLTAPRSLNQMNYSDSSNGPENYLEGGEQKSLFTKFCYAILFGPASQLSRSVQIPSSRFLLQHFQYVFLPQNKSKFRQIKEILSSQTHTSWINPGHTIPPADQRINKRLLLCLSWLNMRSNYVSIDKI
jgi:hypothetical protein